jgi:hypothetical protein
MLKISLNDFAELFNLNESFSISNKNCYKIFIQQIITYFNNIFPLKFNLKTIIK